MQRFIFLFSVTSLCALCTRAESTKKTVFINIGFECSKQCGRNIVGTQNDQQFFDRIAKSISSDHVINVDEEFFAKFENKQKFLEFLKSQTAGYESVVFAYSGHGAPTPRSDQLTAPATSVNASEYEFLFGNKKFISCLAQVKRTVIDTCNKTCKEESFAQFKCPRDYDDCETECFKLISVDFPKYSACSDLCVKMPTFKSCDKARLFSQSDCTNACDRKHNTREPYKVFQTRFSPEFKACFENYSLVSSDFENLFKDQKVIGVVDACYAGLFKYFNHKDFLITASSTEYQVSAEDLELKQGEFTMAKGKQMDRICSTGNVLSQNFEDFLLNLPTLKRKGQDPVVVNRLQANSSSVQFDHKYFKSCAELNRSQTGSIKGIR